VFQALRIAVNDELGELARGLAAAETLLEEGGVLAVVTFHSLEDRIAKRFFQKRGGKAARGSRHQPVVAAEAPGFEILTNKAVTASKAELDANPRARSARLRAGRRTGAPAMALTARDIGLPVLPEQRGR